MNKLSHTPERDASFMDQSTLGGLKNMFAGYCRTFYSSEEEDQRNILLKEQHTYNVCADIVRIATEEGWTRERIATAEAVALFHDIGRFEQYRRYRTFLDSRSVNHAALGVEVIKAGGFLDVLPEDQRRLIVQSIGLHNIFAIPDGLDPDLLSFVRLIRDADKLDIWRVFIELFLLPADARASAAFLGLPDTGRITDELIDTVLQEQMIQLSRLNTVDDFKLLQLSWIFDLNYAASFRVVAERDYVGRLAGLLPHRPRLDAAVNVLRTYITRRCIRTHM